MTLVRLPNKAIFMMLYDKLSFILFAIRSPPRTKLADARAETQNLSQRDEIFI